MNQLYDDIDDVQDAGEDLRAARDEHAAMGHENAMAGSQVQQLLAGAGLTVY